MATTTTTKTKARGQAPAKQPEAQQSKPERGSTAEWVVTILILLFGTTMVAQPFVIPTSSMHNTLLTGDHLIVDKISYAPAGPISKHLLPYTPVKRGDIIVFKHPTLIKEDYVKRVIGVPGDHIRLVNKVVYLNGKPLNEPYVIHVFNTNDDYRDNFPNGQPQWFPDQEQADRAYKMLREDAVNGELVVPPGNYFAMGDNRDNSADSRYWGLVPQDNIEGKPLIIFWSYDAPTEDLKDYNVHHLIDLGEHFFTRTRWDRTLRLVHGYPLGN